MLKTVANLIKWDLIIFLMYQNKRGQERDVKIYTLYLLTYEILINQNFSTEKKDQQKFGGMITLTWSVIDNNVHKI